MATPFQYSCLENSKAEEPGGPQSMGSKQFDASKQVTHPELG